MFGSKPFGSTTNSTNFGSTGSSIFGQKTPGTGLFGSTTATPQSTTTSLWGTQKPTTPSLFGNTSGQQSSLFGGTTQAASSNSLFGSPQSKPSLFGSTQPTSSTFGSTSAQPSLFGGGMSSGASGSLFGAAATNGTSIKFQPPTGSDTMLKNNTQQNISTKHMCITAMKEYDGKSIEELRLEDYVANRKGPGAGTSVGGSVFGGATSSPSSSLFGGGGGAQSKGLFGSPVSNSFGAKPAATASLFGSTQTQQQPTASLFGSKPSGGLFGNTNPTPAFGSTATNSGTSNLFGGSTQQTSTFGQNTGGSSLFGGVGTSATNAFGTATTSQPSNAFSFGGGTTAGNAGFGQTATGNLFGSSANNANAGSSLFGSKPAGNSFTFGGGGAAGTNAFGGTATNTSGGSLFGSTANKTLFGATTAAAPSLFGPTQTNTGLFGQTHQPTSNLFGSSPQVAAVAMPSQVQVAATPPIVLGSDVNQRQIERALLEAQLAATPYGDGPLLKWMASAKEMITEEPKSSSVQRQLKFIESLAGSPVLAANGDLVPPSNATKMGTLPNEKTSIIVQDLRYRPNLRRPTLALGLRNVPAMSNSPLSARKNGSHRLDPSETAIEGALLGHNNQLMSAVRPNNVKFLDLNALRANKISSSTRSIPDTDQLPKADEAPIENIDHPEYSIELERRGKKTLDTNIAPPALRLDGSMRDDSIIQVRPVPPKLVTTNKEKENVLESTPLAPPKATIPQDDYFCNPSIEEMKRLAVDNTIELPDGLVVGRLTYGSVFWPGPLRLTKDLNFGEVVVFRNKEVTVYPDEDKKPAVGMELNRPAEVTLERVWPVDKETKQLIKDPEVLIGMKWRERLEQISARMGAIFKDYRPATGSWVFKVDHF